MKTLTDLQKIRRDKTLVFTSSSNWDIWVDAKGVLWSVPKNTKLDCHCSFFGNKHHIKRLIAEGCFLSSESPTEAGLEFLEGLHSHLVTPVGDLPLWLLSFNNTSSLPAFVV